MRPGMSLPVTYQPRLLGKGLPADVADERPLAGVNEKMLPKLGTSSEWFATYQTRVRLAARMNGHVPLEGVLLSERFATFGAHNLLPLLVLRYHMLIEILLRDHPPLAYVTLIFGLVVRPFLVYVERTTVLAKLAADVAIDGLFLVMESHVVRKVSLNLELLRTELAMMLVLIGVLANKVRL